MRQRKPPATHTGTLVYIQYINAQSKGLGFQKKIVSLCTRSILRGEDNTVAVTIRVGDQFN